VPVIRSASGALQVDVENVRRRHFQLPPSVVQLRLKAGILGGRRRWKEEVEGGGEGEADGGGEGEVDGGGEGEVEGGGVGEVEGGGEGEVDGGGGNAAQQLSLAYLKAYVSAVFPSTHAPVPLNCTGRHCGGTSVAHAASAAVEQYNHLQQSMHPLLVATVHGEGEDVILMLMAFGPSPLGCPPSAIARTRVPPSQLNLTSEKSTCWLMPALVVIQKQKSTAVPENVWSKVRAVVEPENTTYVRPPGQRL